MKTAIITGCSGMDGSTLADMLLKKGYKVVGIDTWKATGDNPNLTYALWNQNFILETGDITDSEFIYRLFKKYSPDYFYNMAAISLVPESFKIPKRILMVNTMAVLNILETIREYYPNTRFYQASSSEQIGDNKDSPQNLDSKMLPNSPYAISKLASFFLTKVYRKSYGLFCVNGMLWNHEGPRRGPTFVTRKITLAVANIKRGKQQVLTLGNINTYRDWGISKDYCEAMISMMEADKPNDYAVATGESHTIREFVEEAFKYVDLEINWEGEGMEEVGKDPYGSIRVRISPDFYRPAEVEYLCGDYSKIKKELGWKPKTKFKSLVEIMMRSDLK